MTPVLAVTAFHVLGGVLAAWALVLTFLGLTRPSFPGGATGGRIVGALSLGLVAATISAAVITSSTESEEHGEARAGEPAAKEKAPAGAQKLELTADPGGQLRFDKDSLDAKPGAVTIELRNPASLPHNVSLEGKAIDEEGKTVEKGGVSTVSADVEPGEYTYYCSVPGHRQGGMEGKLTVR